MNYFLTPRLGIGLPAHTRARGGGGIRGGQGGIRRGQGGIRKGQGGIRRGQEEEAVGGCVWAAGPAWKDKLVLWDLCIPL